MNAAGTRNILIVDDDLAMQELFGFLLAGAGYQVAAATDAESARREAVQSKPDLILLDLHLNDANGLEVAHDLAALIRSTVPIVAISASSGSDIRERARQAGCAEFITKPINPATFADEISRLVPTAQPYTPPRRYSLSAEEGNRLLVEFTTAALEALNRLAARTDEELLSDSLLADSAHRWAGASGIGGLPDVRVVARELELLAEQKRTDRIAYMREGLASIRRQYEAI